MGTPRGYHDEPRGSIPSVARGSIDSFYYLVYGLNQATFPGAELVWATVGFTVVLSIFVHGITASPDIRTLERSQSPAPTPST